MLKVSNLSYIVQNKTILDNVSFEILEKEIIAIVGPNGAGKTTILKAINSFIKPTSGNIYLYDKDINSYSRKEKAKLISYVPQNFQMSMTDFTVAEYVATGRYPYLDYFGNLTKEDHDKINHYMEITNIAKFKDTNISKLSGGEMQRVNIATALAQEAKIMFLDEPASFLDPKTKDDIHNLLLNINKEEKTTIVMVTHDINYAIMSNAKFLCLQNGNIKHFTHRDEIYKDKLFDSLFNMNFSYIPYKDSFAILPIDLSISK